MCCAVLKTQHKSEVVSIRKAEKKTFEIASYMFFSNLSVKTFPVTELISDAQLIITETILIRRVMLAIIIKALKKKEQYVQELAATLKDSTCS